MLNICLFSDDLKCTPRVYYFVSWLAMDWITSQWDSCYKRSIRRSGVCSWPIQQVGLQLFRLMMLLRVPWDCTPPEQRQNCRNWEHVMTQQLSTLRTTQLMQSPVLFTCILYLGSDLDSSGYCTSEILRRIGIAFSTMTRLDVV